VIAEAMTPEGINMAVLDQADANLVVSTLIANKDFQALINRTAALIANGNVSGGPTKGEVNALAAAVADIPTTALPAAPLDEPNLAAIAKAVNDDAHARSAE
jgi:hypothetical protein